MNDLIKNINKVQFAELRLKKVETVAKNEGIDVNAYFREQIINADRIEQIGDNWYVYADNTFFTINAQSYEIIAAKAINPSLGISVIDFKDDTKNIRAYLPSDDFADIAKKLAKRQYRDCMRDIAEAKRKDLNLE